MQLARRPYTNAALRESLATCVVQKVECCGGSSILVRFILENKALSDSSKSASEWSPITAVFRAPLVLRVVGVGTAVQGESESIQDFDALRRRLGGNRGSGLVSWRVGKYEYFEFHISKLCNLDISS
jgi:hypothetical protein